MQPLNCDTIYRFIKCCSLLLLGIISASVSAQQDFFQKQEDDTSYSVLYRWKDHFNQTREIGFSLPKQNFAGGHKKQRTFQPHIAQRYVKIQMQRIVQKINPKEARVKLSPRPGELQIEVRSQSQETTQKWLNILAKERENALDKYLQDHYFIRYESPFGQKGVKPDHIRYVKESIKSLLPAAQAMYEQLDPESTSRAYVSLLLSWVQAIPYSTLQDRMTSNGAGFLPPTQLLVANQGDCDSKATLIAALLRSLFPNLNMAIVFLPEHALLAANLAAFDGDEKLRHEGVDYVLLDPTGPAPLKLGEVSESTARFIGGGLYKIEKLP